MELCKLKFMRFIILNGTMTEHYVFFSFFFQQEYQQQRIHILSLTSLYKL